MLDEERQKEGEVQGEIIHEILNLDPGVNGESWWSLKLRRTAGVGTQLLYISKGKG